MNQKKIIKKLYNEIADRYLLTRTVGDGFHGFHNREIEQPIMYSLVPKNLRNKRLLDIGCGPGIHMKKYISRGAVGTGVDISDNMIILAKKHCPKVDFFVGDMENISLKNGYFDVVTSSFSMDYIPDLNLFSKRINSILKKDGLFIFSIPHPFFDLFKGYSQGNYLMTRSYFDKVSSIHNIGGFDKSSSHKGGVGKGFPSYPHQLQEYFSAFIKNGFVLEKFVENTPNPRWKKTYGKNSEFFFMIPAACFFVWRRK